MGFGLTVTTPCLRGRHSSYSFFADHRALARLEGKDKSLVERPDLLKIFWPVGFTLSQDPVLNQVKNNIPHMGAILYAPLMQNCFSHGPKLIQGKQAKALEKLMPLHVRGRGLFAFSKFPQGLIQRAANKIVGSGGEPRVGLENLFDRFG